MTRRPTGIAAVTLAAIALAGCGGGSAGVTPAAYVKAMCNALGAWKTAVQGAGKDLATSGAGTASPSVAKQDYQHFVSALLSATQRATSALGSAGHPSVTHGTEIANGLTHAFAQASTKLAQANSQAGAIRTTSPSVFQLGASSVTVQIRNALQGIAAITPRQSVELRTAAANEPACKVLRS